MAARQVQFDRERRLTWIRGALKEFPDADLKELRLQIASDFKISMRTAIEDLKLIKWERENGKG